MQRSRGWPFWWAIAGNLAAFAEAVFRLSQTTAKLLHTHAIGGAELAFAACWVPLIVWGEGHRALARRFVPKLVARADQLIDQPRRVKLLAPLVVIGLVHAPLRTLVAAWSGVAAIVLAIVVVGRLPPTWRAMVDLGVVLALSYGAIALVRRAFTRAGARATIDDGSHVSVAVVRVLSSAPAANVRPPAATPTAPRRAADGR